MMHTHPNRDFSAASNLLGRAGHISTRFLRFPIVEQIDLQKLCSSATWQAFKASSRPGCFFTLPAFSRLLESRCRLTLL